MKNCGNCECCMRISGSQVYCRKFGIYVSRQYEGCRYHETEGKRANATTGNAESQKGMVS